MNDTTQAQLVKWAQDLGSILNTEIPEFAQQIVSYGFYKNFLMSFFDLFGFILMFCLGIFLFKKFITEKNLQGCLSDFWSSDKILFFWGQMLSFVFAFLSLVSLAIHMQYMCMTIWAPKLYVIQYIMDRAK